MLIVLPLLSFNAIGQQAIRENTEIISPGISPDHSVTLRFKAPEANEVKISGDWLPSEGWIPGSEVMTKGADGVWSYTSGVLPSELYSYYFLVDGLRCPDPNNVYMIRDVATLTNVFIFGGGQADLYRVNRVSHGTVMRRWYDSPGLEMTRRITIYTPPGYETSNKVYPVLYLLHGMGGDEEAWISLGRTAQVLDNNGLSIPGSHRLQDQARFNRDALYIQGKWGRTYLGQLAHLSFGDGSAAL